MANCFFGHRWSPWVDIAVSKDRSSLLQERRCRRCNKAERHEAEDLFGEDSDDWEMPQ
jgi:hypothetical protein